MVPVNVAAIIAAKQRQLISQFRDANAIDASNAIRAEDVSGSSSALFNQLVQAGVLVQIADGRYFLNEEAAEQLRVRQGTAGLLVFIVLFIVIVMILFLILSR